MKKWFLFFLAMIFCIISLVGCSTDDPIIQELPQEARQRSVIADGNEINPSAVDGRSPLITSCYIAPLSCQYWRKKYGE